MDDQPILPKESRPRPVAHLLVVERVVRRVLGKGKSHSVERGYRKELFVDDRVYERDFDVGQDWVPIDTGWVVDPSSIVVTVQYPKVSPGVIIGVSGRSPDRFVPFAVAVGGGHYRIDPPQEIIPYQYGVRLTDPEMTCRVTITAFPR